MYVVRHRLPLKFRSCRLPSLAGLLAGFVLACGEEPTAPPAPAGEANLALASAAAPLKFYQISAGQYHTCGITSDNRAFCWGANNWGQLGDRTHSDRSRPVATAGGLRFHQISAGSNTTCGVTTDYRAYCWGYNGFAQIGDGTSDNRPTPTPVAGGMRFAQIEVGSLHTCGVSYPEKRAYCWGENRQGQLGDGTTTSFRFVPVAVVGGMRFRQVSTGLYHTCGVTSANQAFCWGSNQNGQIGDRSEQVKMRRTPTPVADGHQFVQVDAGEAHNCAVTTDHRAYCWGNGRNGQIGNGKKYLSFWPRAVAGGVRFDRVTAGQSHSCGETTGNQLYCWGTNYSGQLGDGTTTERSTPVALAGGLRFAQASAGAGDTCARTAEAKGYCWGANDFGKLGDGSMTDRHKATAVAGPM